MRYILLLAFAFTFQLLSAQQTMPDVNIKDMSGRSVNIQEYATNGKITVISFWATWCSPCKKELDALSELYEEWKEEYDMEIVAITIDNARGLSKVPGLIQTKQWDFIVLSDANQELQRAMNFQTIPQTYLLDKEGNIVYSHTGYVSGDEYELEDHIAELVNQEE